MDVTCSVLTKRWGGGAVPQHLDSANVLQRREDGVVVLGNWRGVQHIVRRTSFEYRGKYDMSLRGFCLNSITDGLVIVASLRNSIVCRCDVFAEGIEVRNYLAYR